MSVRILKTGEPLLYICAEVSTGNNIFVIVCHKHFLFV